MTCGKDGMVCRIVYSVVEHYFGRLRGTVDDVYAGMHAVTEGFPILETELYEGSKIAMTEESHIGKVVLLAEEFTSVLKIEGIGAMPYDVHGVYLTKPDIQDLGCF
jgi:hypothetical protein